MSSARLVLIISFLFLSNNLGKRNSGNILDQIIKSKNIDLWDLITEDIVLTKQFKNICQNQNPQTEQDWIDILNKLNLWDDNLKRIVLKNIKLSLSKINLKNILLNQNLNFNFIRNIVNLLVKEKNTKDRVLIKDIILYRSFLLLHNANLITLNKIQLSKVKEKNRINKLIIKSFL